MRPFSRLSPYRVTRLAVVSLIVAAVVAVTGFEAAIHAHTPMIDGWHDSAPHGHLPGERELNSCSICRLAHETSSGPVAPGTISAPLRLMLPRSVDRSTAVLEVLSPEHSPRAPPCLASC